MPLGDKKKKFKEQLEHPKIIGGRYQLEDKTIGSGVSSVVIPGIDLETGRKVAVKKIIKFCVNKH